MIALISIIFCVTRHLQIINFCRTIRERKKRRNAENYYKKDRKSYNLLWHCVQLTSCGQSSPYSCTIYISSSCTRVHRNDRYRLHVTFIASGIDIMTANKVVEARFRARWPNCASCRINFSLTFSRLPVSPLYNDNELTLTRTLAPCNQLASRNNRKRATSFFATEIFFHYLSFFYSPFCLTCIVKYQFTINYDVVS